MQERRPLGCQLVYRANDTSVSNGKPVPSGAGSLTPSAGEMIKNKVVIE